MIVINKILIQRIKHSSWNNPNEPRIIIFADVLRELPYIKTLCSKIVYNMIRKQNIQLKLKKIRCRRNNNRLK
jgi:hypothetical protein